MRSFSFHKLISYSEDIDMAKSYFEKEIKHRVKELDSMEDVLANLSEDMAAEQKARATYEYLINLYDSYLT